MRHAFLRRATTSAISPRSDRQMAASTLARQAAPTAAWAAARAQKPPPMTGPAPPREESSPHAAPASLPDSPPRHALADSSVTQDAAARAASVPGAGNSPLKEGRK